MIGIHTPETIVEQDVQQLRKKVDEANLDFAILADHRQKNWNAWGNAMWPSVYLIDKRGYLRYWWYGELNWQQLQGEQQMRRRLEELLAENDL